jgi:NADH:ubiquinone oxidoreductase subunit 5 (subunit L)/multisubunit Na+/H+ antiporter MnhA subunit
MSNDKIIGDALKQQWPDELPAGFNSRLMEQINKDVAVRKRRQTVLSYLLVGGVSLLLVGLAGFLLKDGILLTFLKSVKSMFAVPVSSSALGFSIYIAVIVLFLLFMDGYFRSLREKRLKQDAE